MGGRTRSGALLKDAVDLVLVDYGINDGGPYSRYAAAGEPLPADAELVAVTESVVRFLLSLPSRPVLVYVETGGLGGAAHLADITLYHARVAT